MQRTDGSLYIGERHGHTLDTYHVDQGDSNDCGPHVVTMAVNFWYGENRLDASAVAQTMNRPRLGAGLPPLVVRRIPQWATFPWGIADMLRLNDIPARWRLSATEDDLHRALREDRLVMPIFGEPFRRHGWRWAGWSHVAILYGWDPNADVYWFVDSAMPIAPSDYERALFVRRWQNMGRLMVETLP
jgi:hypothetical protein